MNIGYHNGSYKKGGGNLASFSVTGVTYEIIINLR